MSAHSPATPTLAALRRARRRQEIAMRWLRPAALGVALLVAARTFRGFPAPGWHGAGLGLSVALAAMAIGAAGQLASYRRAGAAPLVFLSLFLAGSAAVFWLQPGGAGLIGALAGVGLLARRLPARQTALPVGLTLAAIGAAPVADQAHHQVTPVLLAVAGLIAIYGVALLTRRLGEGNLQAEQLLVELEQTRGAEVRAAALAERQRLAREMHDVLAHSLSGLALQLEGARLLAAGGPADPRLGPVLDRAHHLARTGVQEARWAIGMLRGDEVPGPDRLAALTAGFGRDSGVPASFTVTGRERDLDAGVRLALYRVAQEALANIRKHARPDRVEVVLGYRPGRVRLTVRDVAARPAARPEADRVAPAAPGTAAARGAPGTPAAPGEPCGYGLIGMRERAELLGGTLTAAPARGGFLVDLEVPA